MAEEITISKNWQEIVNILKNCVDKVAQKTQVAFISNDLIDCEPILLTGEHDENFWPIIIEEPPIDFVNPKWDKLTHQWVDTDVTNTNSRLNQVEESVQSLKKQDENVTKDNNEIKNAISSLASGQAQMLKILGSATSPKAPTTTDSKQDGGSTNA